MKLRVDWYKNNENPGAMPVVGIPGYKIENMVPWFAGKLFPLLY